MFDAARLALRSLRKSPGFTAVAVLTLALGIGASAAAFSVLDAVLLRPLPYPEQDRLVFLFGPALSSDTADQWRQRVKNFDVFATMDIGSPVIDTQEGPQRVDSMLVSQELLPLLGAHATAGRMLTDGDFRSGSNSVLLTDSYATRLFGSPGAAAGKVLHIVGTGYYNETYVVAGTIPALGALPQDQHPALFMPQLPLPRPEMTEAIARLKPGASLATARAEAETIAASYAKPTAHSDPLINVSRLKDDIIGDSVVAVRLLFGAALLVLLIACANVANLVLARGTARAREVAVRFALGASSGRMLRELLLENALLCAAAAAAGLWIASFAIQALVALAPYHVPRLADAHVSPPVFAFAAAVAAFVAAAFALTPLWQARHLDLNRALKEGSRQVAGSVTQRWLRAGLVGTEIAVACVVLVVAGLLVEAYRNLAPANPGFNPNNKLTLRVARTKSREEEAIPLLAELRTRLGALRGVKSVAAITHLPSTGFWIPEVLMNGRIIAGRRASSYISANTATENYFATMHMPIVAGRSFDEGDYARHEAVAVVNQNLARKYFGGASPLGKQLTIADGHPITLTIIGVVTDTRAEMQSEYNWSEIFMPFSARPSRGFYLVLDTADNPLHHAADVRQLVRSVAPDAMVEDMQTMDQLLAQAVAQPRFLALLLGLLAALAVALALAGIYAVMSYSVAQRRHEMGVRIAIGAQTGDVVSLVLRGALRIAAVGIFMGALAAVGVSSTLTSILYGTAPLDARSYLAAALLLLAVTGAAGYLPARAASQVDPMEALRTE
ncbi:MAG TPA: ADOP family duplicated permease [Terriglobales bacterium]|nr:ADOP family duplicated permease [Terriglobales bacterium]